MTILFPIGYDLGPIFTDETDETDLYQIRLGDDIIGMSQYEYGLWRTIAEVDDSTAQTPSTLATKVREHSAEDYRPTLDELTKNGLVAAILPVGPTGRQFTQTHRLLPLAYAAGNSAEDTESFRIYLGGEQALVVSWLMYYLWSMGPTHANLAEGIALAAEEQRYGSAAPGAEDHIRSTFLQSLPTLLARRCAYLDVAG